MTWVASLLAVPLQAGLVPRGTRVEVFRQIYTVFLVLGTLVGIVVVGYMLYNAYKFRDTGAEEDEEAADRPRLGEIPTGGGGGKKLFLSFALSTIVVVSLIVWTYGTLLYVEQSEPQGEQLNVEVVGHQFYWEFVYPNGYSTDGTLRVPTGVRVQLTVTSADVFHNFGVPELRVKSDAIPGQTTESWFVADETGTYRAKCYELCGVGHSYMNAEVVAMEPSAFEEWYANTTASTPTPTPTPAGSGNGGGHG